MKYISSTQSYVNVSEFIDMQAVSGHNVSLYYGVIYNKSWKKLNPIKPNVRSTLATQWPQY